MTEDTWLDEAHNIGPKIMENIMKQLRQMDRGNYEPVYIFMSSKSFLQFQKFMKDEYTMKPRNSDEPSQFYGIEIKELPKVHNHYVKVIAKEELFREEEDIE